MRLKRIYDQPCPADGYRVLVDRVWPRGLSHERARIDEWLKEVAPSTQLRTWYGHQPARFEEFERRYRAELTVAEPAAALAHLRGLLHDCGPEGLTLLTATTRYDISQAAVLVTLLSAPDTTTDA
ncbi:DUF488 domain-containing protein [Phycicoccus ginsengisoli]